MILQGVQVQEVRHVHVLITEGIVGAVVGTTAGRIIIDFDTLYLLNQRTPIKTN